MVVFGPVLNVFTIHINVRHLRIPYSPFNCNVARSLNLKNLNEVTEKPSEHAKEEKIIIIESMRFNYKTEGTHI